MLGSSLAIGTLPFAPARAAANLACLDTLYLANSQANDKQIYPVSLGGTIGAAVYDGSDGTNRTVNQLGIGANGTYAVNGVTDSPLLITTHRRSTANTSSIGRSTGSGAVGAINPANGYYYYGTFSSGVVVLYAYEPTSGSPTNAKVAEITLPLVQSGGDIAFAADGTLYVVHASGTSANLYRVDVPIAPTGPLTRASGSQVVKVTEIATGSGVTANGIAFGSDGYLYLGTASTLTRVNPITGSDAPAITMAGVSSTDLGSCAGPNTVEAELSMPDGRLRPGDDFRVAVTGPEYGSGGGQKPSPTATTVGTTGTQTVTTGPVMALPGQTYTATLTPVGSADRDDYAVGYRCGSDPTIHWQDHFEVTPTTGTGVTAACTFVVQNPVDLQKAVSPTTFDHAGQTLTYTLTARNDDGVALDDFRLADPMPGLSTFSCSPVDQGQTLPAGQSTSCQATYTVTQADVRSGNARNTTPKANTATMTTASKPGASSATTSASATATATSQATGLTAADDARGTQFDRPVTFSVAGNDVAGTAAVDPASARFTANGGTQLVTGDGTWELATSGEVTFTPDAEFSGSTTTSYRVADANGFTDTATVTVSVRNRPVAADDTARTTYATEVEVDVLDGDTPGPRADGSTGSWVHATLRFAASGQPSGAQASVADRVLTVPHEGAYTIDASSGRITFGPVGGYHGTTTAVRYEVEDQAGNRARATLSVVVRPGPSADADTAGTAQNVTVTDIDVLTGDVPGPNADGTAGSFAAGSATFGSAGRTLVVPGEGEYAFETDDEVSFDPEPAFAGTTTPLAYRVTDSHGNTASATLTVTVAAIRPTAVDDTAVTRYGAAVRLAGLTDDTAGATSAPLVPGRTVFPVSGQVAGALVSNGGRTLTLGDQGTWRIQPDGAVLFTPTAGFSGRADDVVYRIEDANGTTDHGTLTTTVRPGPVARPDAAGTPQNVAVVLTPLTNDDMAIDVDGTTRASLDPEGLVLVATPRLPAGSTVGPDGRSVTVPGQGTWTVGPAGRVRFTPLPQFTGVATAVAYEAPDSFGNAVTATMTVGVDARTPTAVADLGRTAYATPVVVDVLVNDLPAEGTSLVPATVRLVDPATAQPVVEVRVPRQGAWTALDGTVRFSPVDGFTGEATRVRYVVSDVNGTPAGAEIGMSVGAPGEAAPIWATTSPGDSVTLDVLAGLRAAEGEQIVRGSLCVVPGTVKVGAGAGRVAAERCVKQFSQEGVGRWSVNPDGTITFTPAAGFTGTATVGFRVTDTGGNLYSETAVVEVKGRQAGPTDEDEGEKRTQQRVEDREPLPDTGGVSVGLLLAGVLSTVGGVTLLGRSRRSPRQRRPIA